MFLKQVRKNVDGSGLMPDKLGSSGSVYYQPNDSSLGYRLSNSHMEGFERRASDNLTNEKYSSSMKNSNSIDQKEIADST